VTEQIDNPTVNNLVVDQAPARVPTKSSVRAQIVEKIRSELNIEKWPAIWQPAKSKNKPTLRIMERESMTADGDRMVSRVEIGYTHLGTLTTEEQKMLYVLIKLWEDNGKPDQQVFFSSRELGRMLRKKGWGTNVINSITKSLRKLRTIPIEWINSYYDQTGTGSVVVDRRPLTLLGDLRVIERRQDGAVNSSQGYFKFDDHILTNLQLNYTKPVCIEEFFKLRSEIAQLIYSHIDLILFDKSKYERKTRALFDDLGLKNEEYQHMYERKRAIEKALKELQGIRLSSGVLRSATIEKTADGKDYKVSFSKSASVVSLDVPSTLPGNVPPSVTVNDYTKIKDPLFEQGELLVKLFHKIVHDVDNHHAQSKEIGQALALIAQHGDELARFIVEFATRQAAETGFKIQHFGAVLSYASRAVDAFQKNASRESVTLQARPLPRTVEMETQSWTIGEERLTYLTAEQLEARSENVRKILFQENPFLAQHWKPDSRIQQNLVRNRLVQELHQQPMALVILPPNIIFLIKVLHQTQNLPF
jgi:hypothetical protein